MSAEVQVERLRMALAEAGYPHAVVYVDAQGDAIVDCASGPGDPEAPPPKVAYQAFRVVSTVPTPCFYCWNVGETVGARCMEGDCAAPKPLGQTA